MGLETPQYLNDLDSANPTFQDFVAEGDDHIRGLKRAAKQTFPGLNGRAWRRRSISTSGTLELNDNMALINASQTLTLIPAAASVLGNGWMTIVRASGGTVTINPGEPINGAGSLAVPTGYSAIVFSDGTEFYALLIYQDVPVQAKPFPAGTKMLFQQTSAPTGWTKITSAALNDAAIRLTTGTVGTGGTDAFTTTFGTGKATAGFSLTAAHNGPHNHSANDFANIGTAQGGCCQTTYGPTGGGTGSSGSGTAHAHNLNNMNLKYVDCIVASID